MRHFKSQRGFTLVELMAVIGISSIIAYAMFIAMRVGDSQHQELDVKMSLEDSAREGLYKMIQEIRQTAPSRISFSGGGTSSGTSVIFSIPNAASPVLNGTYAVNWDGATVTYSLGGTTGKQVVRSYNGTTKVIANDVTSVTFSGDVAPPNTQVVTVALNLQRQLPNGRNFPVTPYQMTAKAEVRNT